MKYRPVAAAFTGLALLAASAAVPIRGAHASETVDEVVDAAEAVQGRVMLPVRFDIDPVAKTLEAVALPGLEQGLDGAGEVLSSVEVPFELTTAPVASPADDLPPECSPSTTSSPNFTPYPARYANREEDDKFFLQYMFQTNQRDFARMKAGVDTRQFMQCVAGGGRTFTNHEQIVNGAGSTMEDANTSLLINEGGMKWGKGEDPTGVKANLEFKVSKDPVSVTASIDGLGGSGYDGSQGPDENAYYLNDYARNQVNGYWKAGLANATEAYKGNVSLALWEYSMSDTVNRLTTIRTQAWMVYQCGNPWRFLSECTALRVAPAFDGPEITPQEQTTNFASGARWDVLVPQDAQNATTLAFDYGDGTPEDRVTIPVGGGASTFTFSHTFYGTGTFMQRATVMETGASSEARTTNPRPSFECGAASCGMYLSPTRALAGAEVIVTGVCQGRYGEYYEDRPGNYYAYCPLTDDRGIYMDRTPSGGDKSITSYQAACTSADTRIGSTSDPTPTFNGTGVLPHGMVPGPYIICAGMAPGYLWGNFTLL